MKTLSILFGMISFFNAIIAYLPAKFISSKDEINKRFLSLCIKLKDFNNDELALAVRPRMFLLGGIVVIIAAILLQCLGKDDQEVKELSFAWFGIFSFAGLALIPSKEFSKRLRGLVGITFKYLFRAGAILAIIMVIAVSVIVVFQAKVNHHQLNPQLTLQLITELVLAVLIKPLGIYFLIIITITSLTFVVIPFLSRKIFLVFIRRVMFFITKNERKDPIKIPLLIISAFFSCLTIYTYISSKLVH